MPASARCQEWNQGGKDVYRTNIIYRHHLGEQIWIQVISICQFIGPPAMAALVSATGDWQSGAWLTVIACAIGFATAPMLRHLDRRAGLV